jgi:hypothetical protein
MLGFERPWFFGQTRTVTLFCPWTKRDVRARFLARTGCPPVLIGCSEPGCSLACLAGSRAAAAPASPEPLREPAVAPGAVATPAPASSSTPAPTAAA